MTDANNQTGARPRESRIMEALHVLGINLGVIAMLGASVLAFLLALLKLFGAVIIFFSADTPSVLGVLNIFGIEQKPIILMLIDIVDTSLLAAILLTFAFGLKSVFLGKRYTVLAFDIGDINELKEYLIGLVITLMGTRFLETILRGGTGARILKMGVGIAAVILALAVYEVTLGQQERG